MPERFWEETLPHTLPPSAAVSEAPPIPPTRDVFLRICGHLAGETEIRSALGAVAGEIAELIPFTHADICLLDTPGWVGSYEVGIKTRWSRTRTRIQHSPVRDILCGQTDVMLTPNAMEDPRQVFPGAHCKPILDHRLRSRVHVAMKAMGRLIGTLNISHDRIGLYDAASVEVVRQLADVLAPYFHALHSGERMRQAAHVGAEARAREEGLRQGALELTQALERERQRIGMDLHDQTLADLTRILRDVSGDGPMPTASVLAAQVSDCIGDLRRIIDTAVPTLLDLFGFAHALRVHLERAVDGDCHRGTGPHIEVIDHTDNLPDRLDSTTRTALYRIAQEAINNAARHAEATRITVDIATGLATGPGNRLTLSVRDNGRGLHALGDRLPSGLTHMRTRARLIAAVFEIFEDDGTCVSVSLPIPEHANPDPDPKGAR